MITSEVYSPTARQVVARSRAELESAIDSAIQDKVVTRVTIEASPGKRGFCIGGYNSGFCADGSVVGVGPNLAGDWVYVKNL